MASSPMTMSIPYLIAPMGPHSLASRYEISIFYIQTKQ